MDARQAVARRAGSSGRDFRPPSTSPSDCRPVKGVRTTMKVGSPESLRTPFEVESPTVRVVGDATTLPGAQGDGGAT
jgi:hypothetical protein